MSATESTTNILANADLETAVQQEKNNEVESKISEAQDAPSSTAQSSDVPVADDASKIPADDVKVTEDESKDENLSAAIESENAAKVSTSPAKEEVNEEIVNKGIMIPLKNVSQM